MGIVRSTYKSRVLTTATEITAWTRGKTVDRVESDGVRIRGRSTDDQTVVTWFTDGTGLGVVVEGGFYGTEETPAEPATIEWRAYFAASDR